MHTQTAMEWTRRMERAERLQEDNTAATQLLSFYRQVLKIQAAIGEELAGMGANLIVGSSFRQQVDFEVALRHLPKLLTLTKQHGTTVLAAAAEKLVAGGIEEARGTLKANLIANVTRETEQGPERFFALALLQPAAEYLAQQFPSAPHSGNRCPVCDGLPQLAVLRPEGEGAKRSLLCSLCLTEWAYRRVLCPWCGEMDKEKLPRYSAEECNYVRVEACDACKHYLKSIDLTIEGRAVPIIDEVALAALDVWATEQGFRKIAPNLLGF